MAAAGPSNKRQNLPIMIRPGYVEKDTTLPPKRKAWYIGFLTQLWFFRDEMLPGCEIQRQAEQMILELTEKFFHAVETHSVRQSQVASATPDSPAVIPSSSSITNPAEHADAVLDAAVHQQQLTETHVQSDSNNPVQDDSQTSLQNSSNTSFQSGYNNAVQIEPTSEAANETLMLTAMREHSAALNNHAAALDRHTAALNTRTRGSDDD